MNPPLRPLKQATQISRVFWICPNFVTDIVAL
jgi:hypothetical protein